MPDLQDRLRGIAVGAAIGDALGMPLEFRPARSEHDLVSEMVAGPLPKGSFTDDTEMALALAESLLITSPLNVRDLAARFNGWYQSRPSDVGIHTAKVLQLIGRGVPVTEAARQVQAADPDSAGNGSVMRAWPIAIARHNNAGLLASETRLQGEVTHTHPDSTAGALVFNLILFQILQMGNAPAETLIREAITSAVHQVDIDPDFLVTIQLAPMRMRPDLKNSGWVRHTMESALWSLTTTRSFEEALIRAVNLGNDADTPGCVTGAIAGAMYGLEGIPARWKQAVHGEYPIRSGKLWFLQEFIDLVDRLAAVK